MRDSSAIYLFYFYHTVSSLSSLNCHQVSFRRICRSRKVKIFSLKPKWSDLLRSEASLKTFYPGSAQTAPLSNRTFSGSLTHCVQQVKRLATFSFAQIRRIAILPILSCYLFANARQRIDQTDSSILWYFTARLVCAKYQIGQTDSSTLWHSTACLHAVRATK